MNGRNVITFGTRFLRYAHISTDTLTGITLQFVIVNILTLTEN